MASEAGLISGVCYAISVFTVTGLCLLTDASDVIYVLEDHS